jgi:hypothetical protein
MDKISVRELSPHDPVNLKSFVELERRLVGAQPLFVSNLDPDVIWCLSGKSAYFGEMDYALFMVSDGNQAVARCAALINRRYQRAKDEAVGFIGYFAAAPDHGPAVQAMLEQAEAWLKAQGVRRSIAPFNGNAMLGMGFLVAAFDEEPVMAYGWNPPYYSGYLTSAGYQATYPLLVYKIEFSSPKYRQAVERAKEYKSFQVRPIRKSHWHADLEIFRQIINEAFVKEGNGTQPRTTSSLKPSIV